MFGKGSKKSAGGSSSDKARKEPKNKYAASTTSEKVGREPADKYAASTVSEKMARRNATSLASFYKKSSNVNAQVAKVRIVVHTTGYKKTHDGRSGNHWSIFLTLAGQTKSVRLNMSTDGLDDYGHFEVTDKTYLVSNTRIQHFDYPVVPGRTVDDFCKMATSYGRDRYMMSGTGNGCRFWVWTVFNDMLQSRYIAYPDYSNLAAQFYQCLQLKYHEDKVAKVVYKTPSQMEPGHFLA